MSMFIHATRITVLFPIKSKLNYCFFYDITLPAVSYGVAYSHSSDLSGIAHIGTLRVIGINVRHVGCNLHLNHDNCIFAVL